ncbi:MFS transporter [Bdellovibrio bacteriovorus]|uniref:Putative transport protein n=1 Tax=Bdellovibrio bacteriovorus (strain ATCC 15356 / DSM 50701 / NCIMB 9529 / HD100) TaxID=264462 RepID=Q6MH66_BDEBA|nr:MFS transporter [Bdellovibrio bacteriovorus]CAE81061.1 putative transport protein [Bdellovibrio bacteriovorus HD100]
MKAASSWSGIWALTLGVSGLMIAEFLPAGLLTSLASDLRISEGAAGQAVTATSIFAVIASLLVAYLTRKYNRRTVLLWLSSCMAISSLVVAAAPNLPVLLAGRAFLGIALGGFWSMSTAIAIRLVPAESVPKALSIIFGGASFAALLAAPLGSFLGDFIGWRNVFTLAALMGAVAFIWQYVALPSLSPTGEVKLRTTWDVLKIPNMLVGLVAINLAFGGRFASLTYMKPFLEQITMLKSSGVSLSFLIFDLAFFLGTLIAGRLITRSLRYGLTFAPLVLAASSLGLIAFGSQVVPTVLLLIIFGAAFAPIPVAWSTWTANTAPESTETAGGLYVASVQLSAAVGAMLGGVAFDSIGSKGVFWMSGLSWGLSALVVFLFIGSALEQIRGAKGEQWQGH